MSFGRPDDQIRYGSYLCIPQLLELQRPLTKEHDEMRIHRGASGVRALVPIDPPRARRRDGAPRTQESEGRADDDALGEARRLLDRVAKIQDVLLQHLPVVETMRPADFLRFRDVLKPASGFQSVQFREIEFLAGLKDQALFERCDADPKSMASLKARLDGPTLRERFAAAARSRGFDVQVAAEGAVEYQLSVRELCRLYQTPTPDAVLCALAEAFCDFDERLIVWRSRHISMVERVIGGKIGTGYAATGAGYEGVRYLATTLRKRAFPDCGMCARSSERCHERRRRIPPPEFPARFNMARYFLTQRLEEGLGGKVALLTPGPATPTNRSTSSRIASRTRSSTAACAPRSGYCWCCRTGWSSWPPGSVC